MISGNLAASWGNGNSARAGGVTGTEYDRNLAVAAGQFSTATVGPGSNNRVVVVGLNKDRSESAAAAGAAPSRR